MRFLCLHGLGGNSQVLETQTAPIRYELDEHHRYDFVEGTEPSEIAEEIKGFFSSRDEYFRFHGESPPSIDKAVAQLHRYVVEEGSFDGVMGFSQGAALAATYMVQQNIEDPARPLPFRCAIFFSSSPVFDMDAIRAGYFSVVKRTDSGAVLPLPTAHIWGSQDVSFDPFCKDLAALCNEAQQERYVHKGGHEIPGARATEDVQRCVRAINRTIDRALVV